MPRPPSRTENQRRFVRLGLIIVVIGSFVGGGFLGESGSDFFEFPSRQLFAEEMEEEYSEEEDAPEEDLDESESPSDLSGAAKRLKLSGRKLRAKQRQVQAVVLLFMGVVILGIAMFVSLLLYGSWMRRMNRGRGPPPSLQSELERIKNSVLDLPEGERSADKSQIEPPPSDGKSRRS